MSRHQFKQLQTDKSEIIIKPDKHAYISIYGHDLNENIPPYINHSLWFDGIQLKFDDTDTSNRTLRPILSQQADTIVEFLKRIHESSNELNLIIHCFAGISRSAGIAKFVNDVFHLGDKFIERYDLYNRKVYSSLVEAFNRSSFF